MSIHVNDAVFYQEKWLAEESRGLSFLNSALFFGESTFTTMRLVDGEIYLGQDHFDRLQLSLGHLFSGDFESKWERIEAELIAAAQTKKNGYLRATFFRSADELDYFFYHRPFELALHENPEIALVRARGRKGVGLAPSFLKTSNYLESHLELKWANEQKFQEVLYLATDETILECTTSNIFWVSGGQLFTPALRSGVLEGVMRKNVIKAMKDSNWPVTQGNYKVETIKSASEVWLTNALRGLTAVSRFEDVDYPSREVFAETIKILRDF